MGGLVVSAPPAASETPEATSRAASLFVGAESAAAAGSVPSAARREAAVHDDWYLRRFHPSGTGDLSAGLLGCRGNVLPLALGTGSDVVSLSEDGVHDGLVSTVQGVDGILAPQRIAGGVHGRDAKARVHNLQASKVIGE